MKKDKHKDDLDQALKLLSIQHVWKNKNRAIVDLLNRLLRSEFIYEEKDWSLVIEVEKEDVLKNENNIRKSRKLSRTSTDELRVLYEKIVVSSFCCKECIHCFNLWMIDNGSSIKLLTQIESNCIKKELKIDANMNLTVNILLNNWKILRNNEIRVLWVNNMNQHIVGKYALSGCTFSMIILFIYNFDAFKFFAQTILTLHGENKLFLHTGLEEWEYITDFYTKKFKTNMHSEISNDKVLKTLFVYLCIDGVFFDDTINDIIQMYLEIPGNKKSEFLHLKILFCIFTKTKKIDSRFKSLLLEILHSDHTAKIVGKEILELRNQFILYTQEIYILIDSLPIFMELKLDDIYFEVFSNLKEGIIRKELFSVIIENASKINVRDFINKFCFYDEFVLACITNEDLSHRDKTKSLVKRSLEVLIFEFYNSEKTPNNDFIYNLLFRWNTIFIEIIKIMKNGSDKNTFFFQDLEILLEFLFFDISSFVNLKSPKLSDIFKKFKSNVRIVFGTKIFAFNIDDKHKIFLNVLVKRVEIREFVHINPKLIEHIILCHKKYNIIIPDINIFYDILYKYHFDEYLFLALLDFLNIEDLFEPTIRLLGKMAKRIDRTLNFECKCMIIDKLSKYNDAELERIIEILEQEIDKTQQNENLNEQQSSFENTDSDDVIEISSSFQLDEIKNSNNDNGSKDILIIEDSLTVDKKEFNNAKMNLKDKIKQNEHKDMNGNDKHDRDSKEQTFQIEEKRNLVEATGKLCQFEQLGTNETLNYHDFINSDPSGIPYKEKPKYVTRGKVTLKNEYNVNQNRTPINHLKANRNSFLGVNDISMRQESKKFKQIQPKNYNTHYKSSNTFNDQINSEIKSKEVHNNSLKKDIELIDGSYNFDSFKPCQKKSNSNLKGQSFNFLGKKSGPDNVTIKTIKKPNHRKNVHSVLNQFNKPNIQQNTHQHDKNFDPYLFSEQNLLPPIRTKNQELENIDFNFIYQALLSNSSFIEHLDAQKYSFTKVIDYVSFFAPLVINEIKANLKKDLHAGKAFDQDNLRVVNKIDLSLSLKEIYCSLPKPVNYIENDFIGFKKNKLEFFGILKEVVSIKDEYVIKVIVNNDVLINRKDMISHRYISSLNTYFREYNALFNFEYFNMKDLILNPNMIKSISPSEKNIEEIQEKFDINVYQAEVLAYVSLPANKLTLVQGPPGSGKTTLIIALINAFFSKIIKVDRIEGKSRILICAPSNTAIDEVIRRLKNGITLANGEFFNPFVLRIGVTSSLSEETKEYSLDYLLDQVEYSHSSQRNLRKIELLMKSDIICSTLSSSMHDALFLTKLNLDFLVIDEACQGVETSTLIPFKHNPRKIILIGDPKQLPPTIINPSRYYEFSLFQRLSKFCKPLMLSNQYRMSQDLVELPSKLFYNSLLVTDDSCYTRVNPFENILDPLSFVNVNGEESFIDNVSYINHEEAIEIISFVYQISMFIANYKVAIITPYKAQVNYLTKMINETCPDITKFIDINTVDAFQGQEKDIVIISVVRSNKFGFINDERRLNVALTRARFACLIFGNIDFLSTNDLWVQIIDFCNQKNRLYDSSDFSKLLEAKTLSNN